MKKSMVAIAMGATVLTPFASAGSAAAQSAQRTPRKAATERFDIPAGGLAEALQAWSKITKREIVYRMDDVGRKTTGGLHGNYEPMFALSGLLAGTGLKVVTTEDGAVALAPLAGDEVDTSATPDILVQGKRNWSLNTGIERTQDDSQPFIVMGRKEIERSGAPNLESFLRNQLNVNTSPVVANQTMAGGSDRTQAPGISSAINLRGIGLRDTLILIDGRRQPGVNLGTGDISQPSITGIPIAAVERIEVLASSASGIYGSGASGGVINIVLRRDFKGGELALNYDNTTDFAQGRGTIDLTAGIPIENGRTRISITGNWTKSDPLLYGDRQNLRQRGLDAILANDPYTFYGAYLRPPQGAAVNFKSSNSTPLKLKPAYGGQTLSSAFGNVPAGYAGLQASGVGPLLAGIGGYNFDQSDTASGAGARAPLIYGVDQYSGSLAVRRTFNSWLTGYVETAGSRSSGTNIYANSVTSFSLLASAPNNPFTQNLTITLPGDPRYDVRRRSSVSTFRTLAGAIVKLPWEWQAVAEVAYSQSTSVRQESQPTPDENAMSLLATGRINALRDVLNGAPLNLPYNQVPYNSREENGRASNIAPSLRLAGPLPFTLPGGTPQMTLNAEVNYQRIDAIKGTTLTTLNAVTTLTPSATQTAKSLYGEVVFPILGNQHQLPLIRLLELRVSARHENYKGDGADPYTCIQDTVPGQYDYFAECPPAGTIIPRSTTRNSHTDPSVSLLWSPVDGVTLRGSYTTGYLPPQLNQLVRLNLDQIAVAVADSARGGEPIGDTSLGFGIGFVPGFGGGNPNLRPEVSKTWTAGVILKPHFIDGLRFSVDWTRLRKRDVYFSPLMLITSALGGTQAQFDLFLKDNPDRVIRGPASGGFAVGPITSLDLSLVNLKSLVTEAFDFTLNYDTMLFGGTLSAVGRATYVDKLAIQPFADAPEDDYAGVVTRGFAAAAGSSGSLRWRGSGSVQWTKDAISFGWQTRYMSGYYLLPTHEVISAQGSAKVSSQMYHDMNITYRLPTITIRAGINNVFNRLPPLDATQDPLYYSAYGDPRLRNFYLGVTKSF
ncbi:TonB-dependent receptor [Sphingomonas fuzhouensis]|uniref:TonB-dependent receptor n=1 Tax=Sphingomonas fuzhouensis TaxID=3106033 RepID=UPI002AFF3A3B|nr:TonB-dependent receptor [Sphingomonas sp. SGZ-02]